MVQVIGRHKRPAGRAAAGAQGAALAGRDNELKPVLNALGEEEGEEEDEGKEMRWMQGETQEDAFRGR